MSRPHIPYFDFYPADFMNGVRGLSAQEVGVYTMILCRIYEESGAIEFHPVRLATYCGMRENAFSKIIVRLVDLGKFNLVDGMLSNRRAEAEISRRASKLKINSRAGKASAQKKQQIQPPKPTDVQRTFNHTDTDTDTRATLSSVAPAQHDFDDLQSKLIDAAGDNGIQPHGAFVVGPIVELITAGVDLETDILPVIRARVARMSRPAGSWSYFIPAIREAYERRVAAGKGLTPPPQLSTADEDWSRRLRFARKQRLWSASELGPAPGQPGCRVPAHLLEPSDGNGWADMSDGRRAANAA
ncbi:hypothetical protein ASD00_18280 [Ensifer sp. Root31]|uniref:DUF1376 domain-containing protein n=1 Tax=Ensifer sp. Root31 TaxID=1736512 RepID=UPI00070F4DA4|nr:DUF1376 domain-containing protein [Ensifer sp. Root31]KQU96797.1 hypothetical protein ASD00_18280 [Ensifer sp. Root31]